MRATFRWLFAISAIAASVVSCERTVIEPSLSAVTERFTPSSVYRKWWAQTEACSGLEGNFDKVSWYKTPETTINVDGEVATAYWSSGSNRIVLTQAAQLDGQVVRHEMLHALIKGKGVEHPREQFLGKCRGVVHCEDKCIPSESAYARHPSWKILTPDSLTVSVTIDPAQPSMSIDDGNFQVIVEVRNTTTHDAIISLTPPYPGFLPYSFIASLGGPFGGPSRFKFARDYSSYAFEAGETKREVFDFNLAGLPDQAPLGPGRYRISGKYGTIGKGPIIIDIPAF